MRHQKIKTSDRIVRNQHFTLLELLDRLLDKGVMVKGEILLSVADIDLVYLNLGLLLSSVKTVEEAARRGGNAEAALLSWQTSIQGEFLDEPQLEMSRKDVTPTPLARENSQRKSSNAGTMASTLPSAIDCGLDPFVEPGTNIDAKNLDACVEPRTHIDAKNLDACVEPRTHIDAKNVEKGLVKLVLTLVDLIRKLMEKQALRRIEAGQLNVREIERVGNTFLLLDERMGQLKKTFGLNDEDLNLDLGPLGELV